MLKAIITVLIIIFSIILITILALVLNKRYKNKKLYKKVSGGGPSDDEMEEIDIETKDIYNCDFDTQKFISAKEDSDKISAFINNGFKKEIDRMICLNTPESGKYILSLLKVDNFVMNKKMYKRFQNIISKKFDIENKDNSCSNCSKLSDQNKKLSDENNDLKNENKDLTKDIEKLNKDNKKLSDENNDLKNENKKISDEKEKLLEANKDKSCSNCALLSNQNEQLNNKIKELNEQLNNKIKENDELLKQRDEERNANTSLRYQLADERENRSRDVSRLNTEIMVLMRDKEQLEEESCERQRLLNRHVWITRQANDECDSRLRALYEGQLESACEEEEKEEVTIEDKTKLIQDINEIKNKIDKFNKNIEDYDNKIEKDNQFSNSVNEIKQLFNIIDDTNKRLNDTKNGKKDQVFFYDILASNLDYIDYLINELLKQYRKQK